MMIIKLEVELIFLQNQFPLIRNWLEDRQRAEKINNVTRFKTLVIQLIKKQSVFEIVIVENLID